MAYKVLISVQANNDIESIYKYILKDGKNIAKKQINIIYSSFENLQMFPNMGVNLSKFITTKNDYRFIIINKTYVAFYKVIYYEIRIVQVFRTE